jgi:hypothetical protein
MRIHSPGRAVHAHDPLVCGLGWDTDCSACRAATLSADLAAMTPHDLANRRWEELNHRHGRLFRSDEPCPWTRPEPDSAFVRWLVSAFLSPAHRALLRELLLAPDVLGEPITDICLALNQETRRE